MKAIGHKYQESKKGSPSLLNDFKYEYLTGQQIVMFLFIFLIYIYNRSRGHDPDTALLCRVRDFSNKPYSTAWRLSSSPGRPEISVPFTLRSSYVSEVCIATDVFLFCLKACHVQVSLLISVTSCKQGQLSAFWPW